MRSMAICCLLLVVHSGAANALDFSPTRAGEVQGILDAMEYDSAGNLYILGKFAGTLDFNPAPGVEDNKTSVNASNDIYVTRFNADGSYAWTQTFGGSGEEDLGDLKLSGSVLYVCGYFSGSDAGFGGAGTFAASGFRDGMVFSLQTENGSTNTAFGTDGVVIFTGSNEETVESMTLSADGTLYVTGNYSSVDMGIDGPGSLMTRGLSDVFVASLSLASGAPNLGFGLNGLQSFGGSSDDRSSDVLIDGTSLYVCGSFSSSDASIGSEGNTVSTAGQDDFFIFAINVTTANSISTFKTVGIQTFGGLLPDNAYSMSLRSGVLFVVGDLQSVDAHFLASANNYSARSQFISDWCVLALNTSNGEPTAGFGQAPGGFQQFGTTGGDGSSDIAVIGDSLYLVGIYSGENGGVGPTGGSFNSNSVDQGAILALSATTGLAQTPFGTSGLVEPFKPLRNFAYHVTNQSSNLAVGGRFELDDTSYVHRYNTSNGSRITTPVSGGGGGGEKPPKQALTAFLATPNPAAANQNVSFTADISLKGTNKMATLDFGDGTPPLTFLGDSLVDTLKAGVIRTFAADGAYEARLTISSSTQSETATLFMLVGNNTQVNPVSGMSSTATVAAGQVNLSIDISRVAGATTASTNFTESLGREIIDGIFITRSAGTTGIVVADSVAKDAGGFERARVRKTIVVSSRDAQESGANDDPPSTGIKVKKFSGAFVFTGAKTDKIGFNAELAFPATFQPAVKGATAEGLLIHVGIGNVLDSIRVDAKGKPLTASTLGRLKKFKISFPKTSDKPAKISGSLELVNASAAGFDTEGIQAELRATESLLTKKGVSRSIQFAVVIDGIAYNTLAPVLFKVSTDAESGKFVTRKSTN